jgi:hypothetical protein
MHRIVVFFLFLGFLTPIEAQEEKKSKKLFDCNSHYGEQFFSQFIHTDTETDGPAVEIVVVLRTIHEMNTSQVFVGTTVKSVDPTKAGKARTWVVSYERKEWRKFEKAALDPKRQPAGIGAIVIHEDRALIIWSRSPTEAQLALAQANLQPLAKLVGAPTLEVRKKISGNSYEFHRKE